jgi:hypothetical protein
VFLIAILVIDFVPEYSLGGISRQKLLVTSSTIFIFLVVVLSSARWGI